MKKTTFIIPLIGILGVIVLSWLYGFSTGPHYERCWKAFYYCSRIGIAVSFLPSLFLALSLLRDQKTTKKKLVAIPVAILVFLVGPYSIAYFSAYIANNINTSESPPHLF